MRSILIHRNISIARFVGVAALVTLASAQVANAQRIHIVVGGPNFRPYPIAVASVHAPDGADSQLRELARELTETLQFDVDIARATSLVPPNTYLAPEREPFDQPNFANWVNVGASGLVRGMVTLENAKPKVHLRFFDVVAQREILHEAYDQGPHLAVTASHRFVDLMIETLTGEQGIFSSQIAFVKSTSKGKAIFAGAVDGMDVRRLTDNDSLSLLPSWSRDGRQVLFTAYFKGNPDLYRIGLADNAIESVSNRRGLNTGANVSPDGHRIALTLSMDGNTEIYTMDLDGSHLRRLTDSWGLDVSPAWSSDGKQIVFVSSRSGNPHLYVMNADGSNQRRITFQGNYNQEPSWSPRQDGQIAFTARDERLQYDVFLVNPGTTEITRLTQDQGSNEHPSFSPDGQELVFTSTRGATPEKKLFVMDADGINPKRISRQDGEYETPAWGPRLGYR